MKKTIVAFVLFALSCTFALAQETKSKEERFREKFPFRYEVRFGWSGYPVFDDLNYGGRTCCDVESWTVPDIDNFYGIRYGDSYMTGILSGEFVVHFRRWFSLGATFGVNGMWRNVYDTTEPQMKSTERGAVVTILPTAYFNWVNLKYARFYSGVGLGVSAGCFHDEVYCFPAFQVIPVGVNVGYKVFCLAETAVGTSWLGGKIGVGVRF